MMQEIKPSIWQTKGNESGKIMTVMGGVHGNEKTGIEVILKLKSEIDQGKIKLTNGTLYLVLGNPRAIEICERGSEPFADLNRSWPVDLMTQEPLGTYEDTRAREIAPLMQQSDVVIDLHATNKPSEPFIASAASEAHEKVYRWFPCKKVLTDPNSIIGGSPVTGDEYVDAHGGVGVCYESGQADDVAKIDIVFNGVVNALIDLGMIKGNLTIPSEGHEIYEMVEPIILTENGFMFSEGVGNASWESFEKGDVIGAEGNQTFVACYDGVIMFPKPNKLRQVGKPLAYLAKRVR